MLILTVVTAGCNSDAVDTDPISDPDPNAVFVPTDVLVKTKGYYTIDKVFEFVNAFDHDVEVLYGGIYNSSLPSDKLSYVLSYIDTKPYTDTIYWRTYGYLHYQTKQIFVYPRMYRMKTREYQADWLNTRSALKLTEKTDSEVSGWVIYFHVPEGHEKEWVTKFRKLEFVEWAELNHVHKITLD